MLRAAMRNEQHYAIRTVERVEVVIRPVNPLRAQKSEPHYCIVQPANSEFLQALHEAGIEAKPEPPIEVPKGEPELPSLEDFDYGSVLDRETKDDKT